MSDVKATYLDADGVIIAGRTRIKGVVVVVATAGANPVILYDNATAASGSTPLKLSCAIAGPQYVDVPGQGILCDNGIFCDTGSAASVTVFYG